MRLNVSQKQRKLKLGKKLVTIREKDAEIGKKKINSFFILSI